MRPKKSKKSTKASKKLGKNQTEQSSSPSVQPTETVPPSTVDIFEPEPFPPTENRPFVSSSPSVQPSVSNRSPTPTDPFSIVIPPSTGFTPSTPVYFGENYIEFTVQCELFRFYVDFPTTTAPTRSVVPSFAPSLSSLPSDEPTPTPTEQFCQYSRQFNCQHPACPPSFLDPTPKPTPLFEE